MEKKLPKVFANTISKPINNNKKVYTQNQKEETKEEPTKKITYQKTINQKIDDIFKSKKYIYKVPVKITTDTEEITKNIIGKNNKNIITIENELIEIEKIKDIEILAQEKNE